LAPQQKQREHAVIYSVGINRHRGTGRSPQQKWLVCRQACRFQCGLNLSHHIVNRFLTNEGAKHKMMRQSHRSAAGVPTEKRTEPDSPACWPAAPPANSNRSPRKRNRSLNAPLANFGY
jgi:hypothetical protein